MNKRDSHRRMMGSLAARVFVETHSGDWRERLSQRRDTYNKTASKGRRSASRHRLPHPNVVILGHGRRAFRAT